MELDQQTRERLKQERLEQYKRQMFVIKMDMAALEAVGDTERLQEAQKAYADLERAYKAVEAL